MEDGGSPSSDSYAEDRDMRAGRAGAVGYRLGWNYLMRPFSERGQARLRMVTWAG